jgi:uncharacterized membrane protein YjfL (UPF0719 family)
MNITIVVINFLYALVGACFTIAFMALGFKVFDQMTSFDTPDQLAKGNIAVGIVVGSIFVGGGIAMGLVVGMGLN